MTTDQRLTDMFYLEKTKKYYFCFNCQKTYLEQKTTGIDPAVQLAHEKQKQNRNLDKK